MACVCVLLWIATELIIFCNRDYLQTLEAKTSRRESRYAAHMLLLADARVSVQSALRLLVGAIGFDLAVLQQHQDEQETPSPTEEHKD